MENELWIDGHARWHAEAIRRVSLIFPKLCANANECAIEPPQQVEGLFILSSKRCNSRHEYSARLLVEPAHDFGRQTTFDPASRHGGDSQANLPVARLVSRAKLQKEWLPVGDRIAVLVDDFVVDRYG